MAAAAILNFGKMSRTPDYLQQIIWEDASRPYRYDHMTKSRNRKLIRLTWSSERLEHKCVDLSDYNRYLNQIWYRAQAPHYINMAECAKFTWLENPRWRRPPSWISENVNNSESDRAICTKFGGQMHHGHAEITHDHNLKPELYLRDVIKRMHVSNIGAMMSRLTRALNLQIFILSLCRTYLFALLSRLLICHTSPTNKLY